MIETTPNYQLPYPDTHETADVSRDIGALATKLDNMLVPVGFVGMWLSNSLPNSAWILLDGDPSNVVTAFAYPDLVPILGETSGIINVPDLSGRMVIMAGALPGADPPTTAVLESSGGAASVKLTGEQSGTGTHRHPDNLVTDAQGNHNHGGATGGMNRNWVHNHYAHNPPINPADGGWSTTLETGGGTRHVPFNNNFSGGALAFVDNTDTSHEHSIGFSGAHSHGINGEVLDAAPVTAAQSHSNMPPYFAVNYIMRGR